MMTKRLVVWAGSVAFGLVSTAIVIFPDIQLGPIAIGFGTTIEKFAYSNVLLLFLAMGSIAFIWLDYLLKTDYLKR